LLAGDHARGAKLGKKVNLSTKRDQTKPKARDTAELARFMRAAREEPQDLRRAFA
jgi:hypothetical protein